MNQKRSPGTFKPDYKLGAIILLCLTSIFLVIEYKALERSEHISILRISQLEHSMWPQEDAGNLSKPDTGTELHWGTNPGVYGISIDSEPLITNLIKPDSALIEEWSSTSIAKDAEIHHIGKQSFMSLNGTLTYLDHKTGKITVIRGIPKGITFIADSPQEDIKLKKHKNKGGISRDGLKPYYGNAPFIYHLDRYKNEDSLIWYTYPKLSTRDSFYAAHGYWELEDGTVMGDSASMRGVDSIRNWKGHAHRIGEAYNPNYIK